MKFASWGDVYFSGLSRGYDPGYAAHKADQWEKREVVMYFTIKYVPDCTCTPANPLVSDTERVGIYCANYGCSKFYKATVVCHKSAPRPTTDQTTPANLSQ